MFLQLCDWIFLNFKDSVCSHAMELLFKVQLSAIYPTSNAELSGVFTSKPFCEFNRTSNGNSHYKSFVIFLSNRRDCLSDDLVTYSPQRSKRIDDEKNKM